MISPTAAAGKPDAPPVLLHMGTAAQSITRPDAFCNALVEADLQVIRFDNRDARVVDTPDGCPASKLAPLRLLADLSSASYTLSDMAADTVGLLDALGFGKARVVGASLGGFIAQTMAIEHPSASAPSPR